MVIDIHSHLALKEIYSPRYLDPFSDDIISKSGLTSPTQISFMKKLIWGFMKDGDCEKLLDQMNVAGVSETVLLIIDTGFSLGEPSFSLEEIFEMHHKIKKRWPDRIKVFAGIDPRRGEKGQDLFKKGVFEYGFCGLKLYPPMGYAMNDKALDFYYSICNKYKLPVLIHTGPSNPDLKNDLAHAHYSIEVAKSFIDINFILAHAGFNLDREQMKVMASLPNVFFDISGFQTVVNDRNIFSSETFSKREVIDLLNSKILFGSDWPLFNYSESVKYQIDHLINNIHRYITNDQSVIDNLLYGNAKHILNKISL